MTLAAGQARGVRELHVTTVPRQTRPPGVVGTLALKGLLLHRLLHHPECEGGGHVNRDRQREREESALRVRAPGCPAVRRGAKKHTPPQEA
ncbi:MAG: hypothetical protein O2816_16030 [Planctomycetota bacterium]|nr:hypothetical protein [Planctomycetota bacterium]